MARANGAGVRKRRVRIAGIGAMAAALGVTRQHLWLVLTGQRESRRLLAQYRARFEKE